MCLSKRISHKTETPRRAPLFQLVNCCYQALALFDRDGPYLVLSRFCNSYHGLEAAEARQ